MHRLNEHLAMALVLSRMSLARHALLLSLKRRNVWYFRTVVPKRHRAAISDHFFAQFANSMSIADCLFSYFPDAQDPQL